MDIKEHIDYSKKRLYEFAELINRIPELKGNKLCIYTTGSYGRFEASENSDLDLFFIDTNLANSTSNIDKTLINADVIKICRKMELPEFSNDGGYLSIHNLKDILHNLGSPKDDYNNYFTARMLLLLESKPIYNDDLHTNCLIQIIERYFIDFHSHSENFEAIFLANDIIRFWKTLCLNYEHGRHRKIVIDNEESHNNKLVAHIKNLKLKFSRKLTCFSFILSLVDFDGPITQNDILKICKMTPIQRLKSVKGKSKEIDVLVDKAILSYQWFLDNTQIPIRQLKDWICIKENRDLAFDKSREFADELFEILNMVDKKKLIRKLLI